MTVELSEVHTLHFCQNCRFPTLMKATTSANITSGEDLAQLVPPIAEFVAKNLFCYLPEWAARSFGANRWENRMVVAQLMIETVVVENHTGFSIICVSLLCPNSLLYTKGDLLSKLLAAVSGEYPSVVAVTGQSSVPQTTN